MSNPEAFFTRAEALLARLEQLLPPLPGEPDWDDARAWRWRRVGNHTALRKVRLLSTVTLADLKCIARQKQEMVTNTRQFINKLPANHALLWGPRGTGKSSLIKALLNEYAEDGLRLIEVEKTLLGDLPMIVEAVYDRPERFILFCDDLSFEANDAAISR